MRKPWKGHDLPRVLCVALVCIPEHQAICPFVACVFLLYAKSFKVDFVNKLFIWDISVTL